MRLSLKEQQLFLKRIVVYLDAGVSIVESLRYIETHASSKTGDIAGHLMHVVNNGGGLAEGMKVYASVFGPLVVSLIEVGENTGTLAEQLKFLVGYISGREAMRRKIGTALVYPLFVLVLSALVSLMLLVYVFPKLMPIFSSLKFQLPLATRLLLWVYAFVTHNWILIALGLVLAGVGVRMLCTVRSIKNAFEDIIIRLPFIGAYITRYQNWYICRTLAVLLKAGLPLVVTLRKTGTSLTMNKYVLALEEAENIVREGGTLGQAFALQHTLFDRQLLPVLLLGEHTGTLTTSLVYMADILETETHELTEKASALFEPVLLVCVGLIVGFIAIAIISPIYGITQSLQF